MSTPRPSLLSTPRPSLLDDPHDELTWHIEQDVRLGNLKGASLWRKEQQSNRRAFNRLLRTGIEFRGYRFWPPFFCFTCGRGISVSQWCFSRTCGGCDSSLGIARQQRTGGRLFAGQVEIDPKTRDQKYSIVERTEERGGFLDPRAEEGKRLASAAQEIDHRPTRWPYKPPFPRHVERER